MPLGADGIYRGMAPATRLTPARGQRHWPQPTHQSRKTPYYAHPEPTATALSPIQLPRRGDGPHQAAALGRGPGRPAPPTRGPAPAGAGAPPSEARALPLVPRPSPSPSRTRHPARLRRCRWLRAWAKRMPIERPLTIRHPQLRLGFFFVPMLPRLRHPKQRTLARICPPR